MNIEVGNNNLLNPLYPLGHESRELERLDMQAELLHDQLLASLAARAGNCLEIGCGNGSNLPLLRKANPELKYTGIDISEEAIRAARSRFKNDASSNFVVMDASKMSLPPGSFDLVFTKLVLWSLGKSWIDVLKDARDLLSAGGVFYALEPCNNYIELFPQAPAAKEWMALWDASAISHGLNPYIGSELESAFNAVGFQNVGAKFFPVIASGREKERYQAITGNLEGFYMGAAAENFGLNKRTELRRQAVKELHSFGNASLVMDALYVAWGNKA